MHVEVMTNTPTTAPTTDADAIAEILAQHMSGPDGCICGQAPEVFWDRELRAHIGAVMIAEGWTKVAP